MSTGSALSEQMAQKVAEIREVCADMSDEQAAQAKGDEWCAKQVLSHLCGADEALTMYEFKRFLEEDGPDLVITPGTYGDIRKNAPLSDLVAKVDADYSAIGKFLAGLSESSSAARPASLSSRRPRSASTPRWDSGQAP